MPNGEQAVRLVIALSPEEANELQRPVEGEGGFQNMLRTLQARQSGEELALTIEDVAKIRQYVNEYGQGGFQDRLSTVLSAFERLSAALSE